MISLPLTKTIANDDVDDKILVNQLLFSSSFFSWCVISHCNLSFLASQYSSTQPFIDYCQERRKMRKILTYRKKQNKKIHEADDLFLYY